MITITKADMPALMAKLSARGARPFTVTLSTEPKFLVKSRDNGDVLEIENPELIDARKISVINCFLNFDYEKSVNRQREREEEETSFAAKPNWFDHTDIPAIVRAKSDATKLYVQLKVEKIMSVNYAVKSITYDRASFEKMYGDYLPTKSKPKNQGVDKPILTMTPALDSIREFCVDGECYEIKG